jgi:hypothetical protein
LRIGVKFENEKDLIDGNKKIIKIFEKKIKTLFEKYLN